MTTFALFSGAALAAARLSAAPASVDGDLLTGTATRGFGPIPRTGSRP